ncbi:rab11 family-interacting protein 4B-like [Mytilus trossulus]|uniref:rab11 family-interacting protein 4B-like n=1 Tax=Mytilus trossulus TaxID=6551 RepID=UPI0030064E0B
MNKIQKMSTPTSDNPDNSHDLDELTRLSSLMDRLTNRVDNLENENQRLSEENTRLNEEIRELKTMTIKLETLNIVFVQEQKKAQELIETNFRIGADEVKRISSLMENEKTRLEEENAQFERRVYNLEEKLKEKSLKLDDVYEKSVRLDRSNTERAQEANRIKELLESGSVVGGDEVMTYVTNRLEHLETDKNCLEDELKTRTLILDETLKDESVKLDDKCSRLAEKCVRLVEEKSDSLEKSNNKLTQEVNQIRELIESQSAVEGATKVISQVGFFAVLTKSVSLGPKQAIEYNKIITNIGNGYDESHGHFKAPVSGLYIISASITSPHNQVSRLEIVRNGIQLAAMVGHLRDMANQTVVVSLNENDQCSNIVVNIIEVYGTVIQVRGVASERFLQFNILLSTLYTGPKTKFNSLQQVYTKK